MIYFVSCFLLSLMTTLVVLRSAMQHSLFSADHDMSGPQKFHARPVPRVGGAGVMIAILGGAIIAQLSHSNDATSIWLLLICSVPTFAAGIAEDLTKNISPRRRLTATAISASLAIFLLGSLISKTGIPGLDSLINWLPLSIALTIFAVTGMSNAVNIIDGFNGLASMCVLMMVLALGYVAFQVSDTFIFTAALITAGAILCFFVWNFPAGLIFLGDGGAYLLGFVLAELGVMLIQRNPSVSPIFVLLLCAYPIFETVFTIYRRKVVRGVATSEPDGIHLHTLIHRRLVRWTLAGNLERRKLTRRNSMTSPYLWMLCLASIIPSLLWWSSTPILACFLLLFVVSYVWLYRRIVLFRTPKWLIFRRNR